MKSTSTKAAKIAQPRTINEDQFIEEFNPLANPNGDSNGYFIDGKCVMLSTAGADLELVKKADPACVWTMFDEESDCDNESDDCNDEPSGIVISNGFSWVNAIGYIITEKPAPTNQFVMVVEG